MSKAGREILPGRKSGGQPPPYAAVPPLSAPTRTVPPENAPAVAECVRAAQDGVALIDPTISGHGVTIRLSEHSWKLPGGVTLALGRSQHRDVVYVCGPGKRIWILTATDRGVRELSGVPLDVLAEIRRRHFG